MITLRKNQLLIVLIAVCVFSAVYGQQSEQPKRQLRFELTSGFDGMTYPGTKYIGHFHVTNDRNLGPWISWITTTSKWKEMSEEQRQFIKAEKMLPKLEEEFKQLDKQAEEKTKVYIKTNYKVDSTNRNEILQHTKKNMEELASYMKLANFELIGLQARIDSIEKFKTRGHISDPGTLIKLDQMLIADEIERAGIMARRNAYENAFKHTKDLYDVISSYYGVEGQKRGLKERLAWAQSHKNSAERLLENPPAEMQPVEIYENKVAIMQVKQD